MVRVELRYVPVRRDGGAGPRTSEGGRRWQLPRALEYRRGRDEIPQREVALERRHVELVVPERRPPERRQLARKVEDTVEFGVEEGLLPQPIAGGEQLPFPFVVNREGEHPFEDIDAPFAELLVGTQDHLGIALRAEPVALADQPLAERSVVVNLAAEHDPARFIVVGY